MVTNNNQLVIKIRNCCTEHHRFITLLKITKFYFTAYPYQIGVLNLYRVQFYR